MSHTPHQGNGNEAHRKEKEPNDQKEPIDSKEMEKIKAQPQQEGAVAREPKPITITDVELEQLKKDAGEYKDKYLRILAEAENARKRLQKEKQELIQYAIQNVIVDFLNPIDHMENALKFTQQMSDEIKHWAIGFQMILTQFKDVLANNGVTPFVSVGKAFDPHCHEAVDSVTTDEYPPGTVIEESLRGYKMGDRIIRPARVKVSKAPPVVAQGSNNKQTEEKKTDQKTNGV
jgi:molecular chaperone GrpE